MGLAAFTHGLPVILFPDRFEFDVSDDTAWQKFADKLRKNKTQVECLVNNAAIQIERQLVNTDEKDWDRIFAVNVKACYLGIKYLVEFFNGGSIINLSSLHVRATSPNLAAYVCTKGAVSAMTRNLASLSRSVSSARFHSVISVQ